MDAAEVCSVVDAAEVYSVVGAAAGGKIKLFARRKRTVNFDPNSEFV